MYPPRQVGGAECGVVGGAGCKVNVWRMSVG